MTSFLICFAVICYALAFALKRDALPPRFIPGPGDRPGAKRRFTKLFP